MFPEETIQYREPGSARCVCWVLGLLIKPRADCGALPGQGIPAECFCLPEPPRECAEVVKNLMFRGLQGLQYMVKYYPQRPGALRNEQAAERTGMKNVRRMF